MNNGYNIEDYLSFIEQGRFDKISNNAVRLIAENLKHSRKQVKNLTIPVVTKRNWFEKLPLHWRLLYYFIGGVTIGLLLPYVW